ncbi:MAG: hypothetical protein ABIG70_14680 [Pseudomonadota bacterium]
MIFGLQHKRTLIGLAIGLLVFASGSSADWKSGREALDQRHVQGIFRMYYTLQGEHALITGSNERQKNQDGAAALVAQIGQKLQNADYFYSQTLGLTHPMQSLRYAPLNLRYVDVHMLRMEDKKGSTGDEVITYKYRRFKDWAPAMTISISSDWRPPGLTPEHEVFHTYQYSYTHFKNAWYLEGMARAMEPAFNDRTYQTETLPTKPAELDKLLTRTYSASRFWSRMMALCDPECVASWDGKHFKSTGQMCGGSFVKAVLEEFQAADPLAAKSRGIAPNDWPESEQWSSGNNTWMLGSVGRAMDRQCPVVSNSELGRFRALLTTATGK